MYTRKDNLFAIGTGVIAGVIGWRLALFLELPTLYGLSFFWLIILFPLLWITVLRISAVLARFNSSIPQFTRFAVIGFTNAFVDFGYLNIFIAFTGIEQGIWFSVFKGSSFIVANISSYLLNKYWVFESGSSMSHGTEYSKFFGVSLIALGVNVLAASIVVNGFDPISGLSPTVWATAGAVVGSATALIVNFFGYKYFVFKLTQ